MARDEAPVDRTRTSLHYTGIACRRCKEPVAEQIDEVTLLCPACGYAWEPGPPVLVNAA